MRRIRQGKKAKQYLAKRAKDAKRPGVKTFPRRVRGEPRLKNFLLCDLGGLGEILVFSSGGCGDGSPQVRPPVLWRALWEMPCSSLRSLAGCKSMLTYIQPGFTLECMKIAQIRQHFAKGQFEFSRHAFIRSVERNISSNEIIEAGSNSEIIEEFNNLVQ